MSKQNQLQGTENMELLVKRNGQAKKPSEFGKLSNRVKWYSSLFFVGLIGSGLCLWAVFYTARSEEIAHGLGMTRVGNSLENILDLLALPVLMFTVILSLYAAQRLYQIYKETNDPSTYRRH